MKKLLLFVAMTFSMMVSAQVVQVQSVEPIALPADAHHKVAGLSPDGSYMLLTTPTNRGLLKYTFQTAQTEVITEAEGAGYNARIASDGQQITYREVSLNRQNLRMVSEKQLSLQSRKTAVLQRATRTPRLSDPTMAVGIENGQLILSVNGQNRILSPNGRQFSYIWPSISPDKQHIVYYVCGVGAYVCDMLGQNVTFLGHDLRAPKWLTSSIVVGMDDKDNGEVVTASSIVVVTLQGQRQVLTDSRLMLMYPYASADGKTIITSSDRGEVYRITLQ